MVSKNIYVVQPYEVGNKDRKSLAIIIPASIARKYDVSKSTILALKIHEEGETITLQKLNIHEPGFVKPTDETLEASNQQASVRVQ